MTGPWTVRCHVADDGDTQAAAIAGVASMLLFDFGALAIGETGAETAESESDGADGAEMVAGIELIAGFASEDEALNAASGVRTQLASVRCNVRKDPSHQAWVDQQREGLEATTIGEWHIRSPWHSPSSPTHDIVIDPGVAFGHGAHPSTRLSLELLLAALDTDLDRRYETVVDLGCGTGIISILAAKAGRNVRATEHDADAVEVARRNIAGNDVATSIDVTHGDATDERIDPPNLVVANVTIDVHREICGNYSTAERIIISGVLCNQVAEMTRLLPQHYAKITKTSGDWAAVDFQRSTLREPHKSR